MCTVLPRLAQRARRAVRTLNHVLNGRGHAAISQGGQASGAHRPPSYCAGTNCIWQKCKVRCGGSAQSHVLVHHERLIIAGAQRHLRQGNAAVMSVPTLSATTASAGRAGAGALRPRLLRHCDCACRVDRQTDTGAAAAAMRLSGDNLEFVAAKSDADLQSYFSSK